MLAATGSKLGIGIGCGHVLTRERSLRSEREPLTTPCNVYTHEISPQFAAEGRHFVGHTLWALRCPDVPSRTEDSALSASMAVAGLLGPCWEPSSIAFALHDDRFMLRCRVAQRPARLPFNVESATEDSALADSMAVGGHIGSCWEPRRFAFGSS